MKKAIFAVLSLLVVAMFLVGCVPQEELSKEEQQTLESELEQLSDEELDSVIEEGESEEGKAIAGEAYRRFSYGKFRYKPSSVLRTAYKVKFARVKPVAKPSWAWKLATTPDDAHNFINGLGAYDKPHAVGSIAATNNGFYIFYRADLTGSSDWGWKLAPNTDDAHDFLRRSGAYSGVPKDRAELAYKDNSLYVFYRGTSSAANWAWKRSTDIGDMYNYINGFGAYSQPRKGTIGGLSTNEIIMFYRADQTGNNDWGWKRATSTDDAYNFLNGIGAYSTPVKEAQIFGASGTDFYIFYRR